MYKIYRRNDDHHRKRTSKKILELRAPEDQFMGSLISFKIFASHSVCTTVARVTSRWLLKFVDEVGSTVFNKNIV